MILLQVRLKKVTNILFMISCFQEVRHQNNFIQIAYSMGTIESVLGKYFCLMKKEIIF